MEKYSNQVPKLLKNSIKALDNEKRQGIMMYLLEKGPKSFMEISNDLKVKKNTLSHHISILMRFGLLYNFYNKNEFNDKYSYYEVSKLGKRIMTSLMSVLIEKSEEAPSPSALS